MSIGGGRRGSSDVPPPPSWTGGAARGGGNDRGYASGGGGDRGYAARNAYPPRLVQLVFWYSSPTFLLKIHSPPHCREGGWIGNIISRKKQFCFKLFFLSKYFSPKNVFICYLWGKCLCPLHKSLIFLQKNIWWFCGKFSMVFGLFLLTRIHFRIRVAKMKHI